MCHIPIPCTETLGALQPPWGCRHCRIWAPHFLSAAARSRSPGPALEWAREQSPGDWDWAAEGGKCWVLAARQNLLASRGNTYSLKGGGPPPALQRYEFSNRAPGECKGKQYFGEVSQGVKSHLLWDKLQPPLKHPTGLLPPPFLGKTTSKLENGFSMWGQPGILFVSGSGCTSSSSKVDSELICIS